jgi:Arc/MetJ family transcription regulator
METNLAIDNTLLEYALQISGMKAESETINLALEEFIKRRKGENIISAFNTVEYDENYNYKELRGKR